MNGVSLGAILVVIGIICWVLLVIGVGANIDLWVLGWAFVVAGWLVGKGRPV